MDFAYFLIQLLNGLQYGLLLFLVASGLTLIFGIMGIINLAHGSFYMIGAYMAFSFASLTGNLFVAIVIGVVLSVILGIVLEWALFSRLYERDHLEQVLLSYGLILVFEELRSLIVGNDGANLLQGGAGAELIYGFDPNGPQGNTSAIAATRVAAGLSEPVFVTAPPGDVGRLFVVEKGGRIQILDLATGAVLATPFLDIGSEVNTQGEQGLLGLAFHPD